MPLWVKDGAYTPAQEVRVSCGCEAPKIAEFVAVECVVAVSVKRAGKHQALIGGQGLCGCKGDGEAPHTGG